MQFVFSHFTNTYSSQLFISKLLISLQLKHSTLLSFFIYLKFKWQFQHMASNYLKFIIKYKVNLLSLYFYFRFQHTLFHQAFWQQLDLYILPFRNHNRTSSYLLGYQPESLARTQTLSLNAILLNLTHNNLIQILLFPLPSFHFFIFAQY